LSDRVYNFPVNSASDKNSAQKSVKDIFCSFLSEKLTIWEFTYMLINNDSVHSLWDDQNIIINSF